MIYPQEQFSQQEQEQLRPYFTNLDRPVFALKNLPETVKGALFARYSRYPGTLRRLFLDEFADSLPPFAGAIDDNEGDRAAALYERIFLGYGDDSVAQLGGAHVACEWTSNVLTKILQRPRLASYLEQSTRYIAYDQPLPDGGFRYYSDPALGEEYSDAMDQLFSIYSDCLAGATDWVRERFPAGDGEPVAAYERATKAKALDLVRGLLPAAALSHMGIFASGQAYEQLIMHLLSDPLPEANEFGQMLLEELQQVIPSFLTRIPKPDRGGEWINFLSERRQTADHSVSELLGSATANDDRPSVNLLEVRGSEDDVLTALLYESASLPQQELAEAVAKLEHDQRVQLLADLVGERKNRRHRPGRGFEAASYRFEVVSDYGAFRDLQRHRLLTVQWQRFSPNLGAEVPQEIIEAGLQEQFERGLAISRQQFERLAANPVTASCAPYALCLAYRIRYILDLNAREAMHLIELRSGVEGHPSYRAVAHAMQELIGQHHPAIAASMKHVDHTAEPRLERLLSEIRTEAKRAAL